MLIECGDFNVFIQTIRACSSVVNSVTNIFCAYVLGSFAWLGGRPMTCCAFEWTLGTCESARHTSGHCPPPTACRCAKISIRACARAIAVQ